MLPGRRYGQLWTLELSTADPGDEAGAFALGARESLDVMARSVTVLRRVDPPMA